MDPEVDIFLPFWWISKHPPQGVWTSKEVRFNSPSCLGKCTKYETNEFSLTWDDTVGMLSIARTIGYVVPAGDSSDLLG